MNYDRFPARILIYIPDFFFEGRAEDGVVMMKMTKATTTVWALWAVGEEALGEAIGR